MAGARPYLVNHLPGTIRLVSKVHLVKFSAELAARLPRTFGGITPETYALPEQARLLDAAMARRGVSDAYGWPNWLAKSKQHRGIHVVSGNANRTFSSLGETLVQDLTLTLTLTLTPTPTLTVTLTLTLTLNLTPTPTLTPTRTLTLARTLVPGRGAASLTS